MGLAETIPDVLPPELVGPPGERVTHKGWANEKNLVRGRPVGTKNKSTREREEFLNMVAGPSGSPERQAFAEALRARIMNGTASPHVEILFLQLLCGKPKEVVEVSTTASPVDPSGMTAEEVAAQALALAKRLVDIRERNTIVP